MMVYYKARYVIVQHLPELHLERSFEKRRGLNECAYVSLIVLYCCGTPKCKDMP